VSLSSDRGISVVEAAFVPLEDPALPLFPMPPEDEPVEQRTPAGELTTLEGTAVRTT